MGRLYEIVDKRHEFMQIAQMLEDDGELDIQAFYDTLEAIEGEFEDKADAYARIMRNLTAEADKFDAEIKRMTERRDALNNRSAMLKKHLYEAMKLTGKVKFKTDLFSFGIQKNGGKQPMEIIPGADVPDEFCKKEPDNAKIREALESGAELPFAILKERGEHLSIK